MAGLQSENISVASFRTEENDRHAKINSGLPRSVTSHVPREERKRSNQIIVATHATVRRSQSANVSSWMDKNTCVFCRRSALVSANDPHAPQFAFFALIDCRHYACQPCALVHCDNAGRFIECPQCHCLSRLAQTGRKRSQSAAEPNTAFRSMNYEHHERKEKMNSANREHGSSSNNNKEIDRYDDTPSQHHHHHRHSSHDNKKEHDMAHYKNKNRLVGEKEVRVSIDDGISSVGSRNSSRYGSAARSENRKIARRDGSSSGDHAREITHRSSTMNSNNRKHGSRKEMNETRDGHLASHDVEKKTHSLLDGDNNNDDNENEEPTKRETSPLTSDALASLPIDPILEERERRIREENDVNHSSEKQLLSSSLTRHNIKENKNSSMNNGTNKISLLDKHSRSHSRSPRHSSPSPPAVVGLYTLPSASTTFSSNNNNNNWNNNNNSISKKTKRSTTPTPVEAVEGVRRAKSEPTVHSSKIYKNLLLENTANIKSNAINDTVDSINNPLLPPPPPLSVHTDTDDTKVNKQKAEEEQHDEEAKIDKMHIEDHNNNNSKEATEGKVVNANHINHIENISHKEENANQADHIEIGEKEKGNKAEIILNEQRDIDNINDDKGHHIMAPLTERARELNMIQSSMVECQLAENEERQVLIDSQEHQRHRMTNLLDDVIRSYYARRQLAEEFEISPRTPSDANVISRDSSMMQTEWTNHNHHYHDNNNKQQQEKNKALEENQDLIGITSSSSGAVVHPTHINSHEDNTSHLDSDTFVSPLQETPDQVSATSSDNEERAINDMNDNDGLSVKLSSTRTSRRAQDTRSSFEPITHSHEEEEEELLNHHFRQSKKANSKNDHHHQAESVVSSLSSSSRIRPHSAVSSATADDEKSEYSARQEPESEKLKREKQMHHAKKQIEALVDEESVLRLALLETNDSIHSQLMHNCTRVAHELQLQHERVMKDEAAYNLWLHEHIERQLQWRSEMNELVNEEQMHRAELTVMEASMRVERLAEEQLESVTINAAVEQREREVELHEEEMNLWLRQRTRLYTLRVNEIVEDERIERDELDRREEMHWQTHILHAHHNALTSLIEYLQSAQEVERMCSITHHIQALEEEETQSRRSSIVIPERLTFIMLCNMCKDIEAVWNEEATNRLNCYRQEQLDWRRIMEEEWNALQAAQTRIEMHKHTEIEEMKKNVNSILDEFSNDKASEEIKEVVSSNSNLPHEVEAEMNYDPVYDDESSDHNSDLNEDNITDIYYNDDNVERNFPQQPSQQDQMKPLCQEELPNTESTVQTNMTAVKYYEQEEQTPEAIRESKHEEFDTPLTLPSVTPQGQLDTMLSSQANQENKQVQHVQSDSALTKDNDHDKSIKPQLQSELLSSSSSSLLLQEKGKSNTSLSSPTITIDNSEVSTTIVLENNENNNKDQGTEEEYREEEEEDHDKVDQEIGDTRTILTIHRSGDSGSESSHGSNEYDDSFTNDDNDNNNINQEEEKEEEDREQRRDVINVRPIILAGSCTSKSLSLTSDMSEELFTESEYTESRSKYTLAPRQASVEEYYHHHNNNKHKQDEQEYDESTHHDAKNLIDRRYSEKWTLHARSEWAMQMAACLHHEHVERSSLMKAEAENRIGIMSDERKECISDVYELHVHHRNDNKPVLQEEEQEKQEKSEQLEVSSKRTSSRRLLEINQDEEVERMSLVDQERLTRQVIARGKEHENAWMMNEMSVQRAYLLQRQFQLALMELIRDEDEDRHEMYDNERDNRVRIRELITQQLQWIAQVTHSFPRTLAKLHEGNTEENASMNLLLLPYGDNNSNKLALPWEQLNKIEQLLTRQEEQHQQHQEEERERYAANKSAIALESAQETLQDALERLTEAESRLKDEATHRLYAEAERQRVVEASEQLIQQVEAKAEKHIAEARAQVQAELQTRLHALRDEVQRTQAQKEMEHQLQMEEQRIRLEAKLSAASLHLSQIQDKAMQEINQARLEAAERTKAEAERMQWASHQREVEFAQRTQIEQLLTQLQEKDVVQRTQLEHHLRVLLDEATEAIHVAQKEAQRATQLAEERLMQLASQQADRAKEIALASAQVQQVKHQINLFDQSHSLSYSSSSSSSSTGRLKEQTIKGTEADKLIKEYEEELKEEDETLKGPTALNKEIQTTFTKRVEQIDMSTSPMHSSEFDYHVAHVKEDKNKENSTTKERRSKIDANSISTKEHVSKLEETEGRQRTTVNEDRSIIANTSTHDTNNRESESTVNLLPLTASSLKKAIYDAVSEMNAAHNTAREIQYRVNESIHHSERRFRRRQAERDEAESAVIHAETSLETDVIMPIQNNGNRNEMEFGEADRSLSHFTRTNSSSTDASKHNYKHYHHSHQRANDNDNNKRKYRHTLPTQTNSKEKADKQTTQILQHASKNKNNNDNDNNNNIDNRKRKTEYYHPEQEELLMQPSLENFKNAHYEMHNLFITPSSSESPISETSDTSKYFDTESLDCIRRALSRDAYYYTQPHLANKNTTTNFNRKNKTNDNHEDKRTKLLSVKKRLIPNVSSQHNEKAHLMPSKHYGKDHLYFSALRSSQNALPSATLSSYGNNNIHSIQKENNITSSNNNKDSSNNGTTALQDVLHYSTLFPLGQSSSSSLLLSKTNNKESEPGHDKVNVNHNTRTKQQSVASELPLHELLNTENECEEANDNINTINVNGDNSNKSKESNLHTSVVAINRITRSTQVSEHVTPNRPSRFMEGNVVLSATQRRENDKSEHKHSINENNNVGMEDHTKASISMEPKTERKKFEAFFVPLYGKGNKKNNNDDDDDDNMKKGGTGATPRRPKPPTPCNYVPMKRSHSQGYNHGPIHSSLYYQEHRKRQGNNTRMYPRKRFLSAQQLHYDDNDDDVIKEDALQEAARAHLLKRQNMNQQQRRQRSKHKTKSESPQTEKNELHEFHVNTMRKHNTHKNNNNNKQTSSSTQRNAWLRNTQRRWQLPILNNEPINIKINDFYAKRKNNNNNNNNTQTFITSSTCALPPEQLFEYNPHQHHEENDDNDQLQMRGKINMMNEETQENVKNYTRQGHVMEQHPRQEIPHPFPRRTGRINTTMQQLEEEEEEEEKDNKNKVRMKNKNNDAANTTSTVPFYSPSETTTTTITTRRETETAVKNKAAQRPKEVSHKIADVVTYNSTNTTTSNTSIADTNNTNRHRYKDQTLSYKESDTNEPSSHEHNRINAKEETAAVKDKIPISNLPTTFPTSFPSSAPALQKSNTIQNSKKDAHELERQNNNINYRKENSKENQYDMYHHHDNDNEQYEYDRNDEENEGIYKYHNNNNNNNNYITPPTQPPRQTLPHYYYEPPLFQPSPLPTFEELQKRLNKLRMNEKETWNERTNNKKGEELNKHNRKQHNNQHNNDYDDGGNYELHSRTNHNKITNSNNKSNNLNRMPRVRNRNKKWLSPSSPALHSRYDLNRQPEMEQLQITKPCRMMSSSTHQLTERKSLFQPTVMVTVYDTNREQQCHDKSNHMHKHHNTNNNNNNSNKYRHTLLPPQHNRDKRQSEEVQHIQSDLAAGNTNRNRNIRSKSLHENRQKSQEINKIHRTISPSSIIHFPHSQLHQRHESPAENVNRRTRSNQRDSYYINPDNNLDMCDNRVEERTSRSKKYTVTPPWRTELNSSPVRPQWNVQQPHETIYY